MADAPKKMTTSEVIAKLQQAGARKVGPGKYVTSAGLKVVVTPAERGFVYVVAEKNCIC